MKSPSSPSAKGYPAEADLGEVQIWRKGMHHTVLDEDGFRWVAMSV